MTGPLAAVGRVVLETEESVGRELGEEVVGGEDSRALPLVDVGVDLAFDDRPDGRSEGFVLIGEAHGRSVAVVNRDGRVRSRVPTVTPPGCRSVGVVVADLDGCKGGHLVVGEDRRTDQETDTFGRLEREAATASGHDVDQ